jgi:hypothetical protein
MTMTPKTPAKKRTPKLGTLGGANWLDLSDYLVHFAKGEDAFRTMLAILSRRVLKRGPSPFGCAVKHPQVDMDTQRAVCLSEIPLGFLHRLVKRRGTKYGIGFHKQFVLKSGGAPLWYLQRGTPQQKIILDMMRRASSPFDPAASIWQLTPFIDFPSGKPFTYDFRWEREWRVASDLHFKVEDVAFLFIPESLHKDAWDFFDEAQDTNTGPGYFCPYIDPTWDVKKVKEALKEAAKRTPPALRPPTPRASRRLIL